MMEDFQNLLPLLEVDAPRAEKLPILLGFDGTIDKLFSVVKEREGLGEAFCSYPGIADFGNRVTQAAGKSAMMELWPKREKIGGNGPISALALAANSRRVRYIGPLGDPLAPAFIPLAEAAEAVYSIGKPATTHALEFDDGKIMLPVLQSYEEVTAERLIEQVGREKLLELVAGSSLIALLNWTCLPHLDQIYRLFTQELLPAVPANPSRSFFFDLADPSKHTPERIRFAIQYIAEFNAFGKSVLGLNFSEAIQLASVYGLPEPACEDAALKATAHALRERTGLYCVMIHPVDRAACATVDGSWCIHGPLCANPVITTGAGDHLNAGFCLALLLGWLPKDALRLGVLFSGYYVRTAQSPSLEDIADFVENKINYP